MRRETRALAEFGDFQTPLSLAREVCAILNRKGLQPASVLEPTCGRGAFLQAAFEAFPGARQLVGLDRDPAHVQQAKILAAQGDRLREVEVLQGDFFETDWASIVGRLPKPILILGNPPWVTNAALGALRSSNLPEKANLDGLRGIEALTGKSNFDISEWMLRKNLEWLKGTAGVVAVLCKTAVARKVLSYAWSQNLPVETAEIRRLDAKFYFGAAVDACLLIVELGATPRAKQCHDYPTLGDTQPQTMFGQRDDKLVADVRLHDRWSHLLGTHLTGWRSGIKHDCSNVFELTLMGEEFQNGKGQRVDVEPDVLFPLLKSSDVVKNRGPRKWLLVPQRSMAASPEDLRRTAPKAWEYLVANGGDLDKRASSVYRNRHRFSVFGVGEYSFSPWKVAVSGLYKKLAFVDVRPIGGRPVVLDDTCYFFPCQSEQESGVLRVMLHSEPAQSFLSAFVFWDAKRPITAQILNLLDLKALAEAVGIDSEVSRVLAERQLLAYTERAHQHLLFREDAQEYLPIQGGDTDAAAAQQANAAVARVRSEGKL